MSSELDTISGRLQDSIAKWRGGQVTKFATAMQELRPRPRGTSRAMVNRYLKGEEPPREFLRAAAQLLGVREEWLTYRNGPRTQEEAVRAALASPKGDASLQWIRLDVLIERNFPDFGKLSVIVQALIHRAIFEYVMASGLELRGRTIDVSELLIVALNRRDDVSDFVTWLYTYIMGPVLSWKDRSEFTRTRFDQYAMASLHALMLTMPQDNARALPAEAFSLPEISQHAELMGKRDVHIAEHNEAIVKAAEERAEISELQRTAEQAEMQTKFAEELKTRRSKNAKK